MPELTEAQNEELMSMEHEKHRIWKEAQEEATLHRRTDMKLRKAVVVLLAIELIVVIGWLAAWVKTST